MAFRHRHMSCHLLTDMLVMSSTNNASGTSRHPDNDDAMGRENVGVFKGAGFETSDGWVCAAVCERWQQAMSDGCKQPNTKYWCLIAWALGPPTRLDFGNGTVVRFHRGLVAGCTFFFRRVGFVGWVQVTRFLRL
eukprot:m.479600 g.479600  ORF g.479600 m.479600 type:complete len:135 (+) comp21515_c0_seq1:378-782(+)